MNILLVVLLGASLGVSMAAPPGPVMAMMFSRSRTSVLSGFLVAMGAMTADFCLMVTIILFRDLVDISSLEWAIYLLGGIYFTYLGYKMIRTLIKGQSQIPDENIRENGSYWKGLTTGLVNPMQISWWLTAGLSIISRFGVSPFVFFYIGIILYTYFVCYIINRSYVRFGEKLAVIIDLFSSIILLIFGFYFIFQFALNINILPSLYLFLFF